MLVWMDLEMTGLDPARNVIVEIATLITDDDLNIVAEGPDLVIHATDEELAGKAGLTTCGAWHALRDGPRDFRWANLRL